MASELFVDKLYPGPNSTSIELSATDSISFKTNGSTQLTIDSSGFLLTPNRPSFSVSYGGGAVTANTDIIWNVTTNNGRHNTGGHYNATNGTFTAPVTGKYQFNVQVHHQSGDGNSATHDYFDIRVNGVITTRWIDYWNVDNWYDQNHSVVLELNVGDTLTVRPVNVSIWMGGNRPDHNRFCGYLIG